MWAAHTSTDLQATHAIMGSLSLNMVSGQASAVSGAGSLAQVAHGVLMLLAFCFMMPSAALLARHKWRFIDPKVGLARCGCHWTQQQCGQRLQLQLKQRRAAGPVV